MVFLLSLKVTFHPSLQFHNAWYIETCNFSYFLTNAKKRKKAHFKIINENHDKCKSRGMPQIPQMKIMTNAKHNGDGFSSLNQKKLLCWSSPSTFHIFLFYSQVKSSKKMKVYCIVLMFTIAKWRVLLWYSYVSYDNYKSSIKRRLMCPINNFRP